MNTITIRKAKPEDISILIDFQKRLATETERITLDESTVRKGMEALFADPSKGFYNVAAIDDQIVGCHMITLEWSDWRNAWVYWLQSVFVKEEFRKHGVFKKMYDNLINTIQNDPGIAGLRLYVDKSNIRAQKVYTSMGMNGDHYMVYEWMKG